MPAAVAAGVVVGVLVRWGVYDVLGDDVGAGRTVLVNAAGCLLMGLFVHRGWRADLRAASTVGFCGGLTTFSTFALDTAIYLDTERWVTAAGYVVATLVASFLGYALGRRLLPTFPAGGLR